MSILGLFNFIIVQWFFVRLCRVTNDINGNVRYSLIYWIVPCSGWYNNYIMLSKKMKFLPLTKWNSGKK